MKRETPKLPAVDAGTIRQLDRFIIENIGDCPEPIKAVVLRTVTSGKRLRPSLTILAAAACQKTCQPASLNAAAAVELIHKASLLHDSVIDSHDDPAYNGVFILAGDYLISRGLQLADKTGPWAVRMLLNCMDDMITGQAMQQDGLYRPDPEDDFYISTITKKTASLFAAAGAIGGRLATNEKTAINNLRQYGQNFGIAFQIIDDITDEEFPKKKIAAAKQAAEKYSRSAVDQLIGIKDGKAKAGLQKLPLEYLASSHP
jgi:geranylgeranyl pyrophosphate synthase